MSEKQFDIFDEQFKNASEQYEPAFNEAAWQKMSAKLDKEQNRRKPFAWLWWFSDALMISLMLYMAITLHYNHEEKTNQPVKQITNAVQDKKPVEVTGENVTPNTISPGGSDLATRESSLNEKALDPAGTRRNALLEEHRPTDRERTGNYQPSPGNLLNNNTADIDKTVLTRSGKTPITSNQTGILNSNEKEINAPVNTNNANKETGNIISDQQAEATAVAGLKEPASNSTVDSANTTGVNNKKATIAISTKEAGNYGFYLHAALAPEWSYIKGNSAGPLTVAFGGGIGYAFGKNWSVQAGLYSTQKNYTAGPGDYKPDPGTFYYNLKIYHVEAKCNILEIPVMVNYSFLHKKRHSLFATAGFSSLVMSKEVYEYDYQRRNGSQAYASRTYKTNNFHPFAATMVLAGYQLQLNKKISLNASPYVKIPLYGVGEGNVEIGSTGLMMGLQYQLSTGKKQKN